MTVRPTPPSSDEIRALADAAGLGLTEEEVALQTALVSGAVEACGDLLDLPRYELPVRYPRETDGPFERPGPEEDPHNAWVWKRTVVGADDGVLHGRRVVIKDFIPVAGMPMTNGSALLEGYVPEVDAVVVTRVLDAGGTIVGGAVAENLCFSSSSDTAATGPVTNPHGTNRSAGGSSSGVAALIASGACDVGIGGDTGGSIRMPAAFCGIVGLKPTWGLVPGTGAAALDPSVDFLGPMGRTVEDVAALLEAIAGPDDGGVHVEASPPTKFVEALNQGADGLRVGLLTEGFDWPEMSDPRVDAVVRGAAMSLADGGVDIGEVSVPAHRTSLASAMPLNLQGIGETMGLADGVPLGQKAYYNTGLARAYAEGWRERGNHAWQTTKMAIIFSAYMRERYGSEIYGIAQNRGLELRRAYDAAFERVDILALPASMVVAPELQPPGASLSDRMFASLTPATFANMIGTNVTGHPAITVPAGTVDGMPVGLQLVGRRGEDEHVLRVAQAYEEAVAGR